MLGKAKLTGIEVLISKALIDSNISYDDFFIINNVLKRIWRYERRNQKLFNQFIEHFSLFIKHFNHIAWTVENLYLKCI